MALILNIDTAVESGSVSLSENNRIITYRNNTVQKDQAAWIHNAIKEMLQDAGHEIAELNAVAVSNGPGSFTGLRIGLSVAKGLCYALTIPLITISTLEIMTSAAIDQSPTDTIKNTDWLCPMIDARRMEVYFAIYDCHGSVIKNPAAVELKEDTFSSMLENNRIIFFGNGSKKLKDSFIHPHAIFLTIDLQNNARHMAALSQNAWERKDFADLALSDPLYIKEFYSPSRKDS